MSREQVEQVEQPTQVLKTIEIPNVEQLEAVLTALHTLELKYTVQCFKYDGISRGDPLPRFTVVIYV